MVIKEHGRGGGCLVGSDTEINNIEYLEDSTKMKGRREELAYHYWDRGWRGVAAR